MPVNIDFYHVFFWQVKIISALVKDQLLIKRMKLAVKHNNQKAEGGWKLQSIRNEPYLLKK